MKVVYKADVVKAAPVRWRDQYARYENYSEKHLITKKLMALEWPFTSEQVNEIIGNTSWTAMTCDECGNDFPSLVRIGAEPDYDARWQDLCKSCLQKAVEL